MYIINLFLNWEQLTFLHVFRCVCKIAKSDYYFIMFVCPPACNNSAPAGQIFIQFDIYVFFENLLGKYKFHWNLKRITGTLCVELCMFVIVACWILLRMRNVLGKIYIENHLLLLLLLLNSDRVLAFLTISFCLGRSGRVLPTASSSSDHSWCHLPMETWALQLVFLWMVSICVFFLLC